MGKLFIKLDENNDDVVVACRVITDDDPQIQLVAGEFVKVAICESGSHQLRLGVVVKNGCKTIKLNLKGATHNDKNEIEDDFYAPTDGYVYEIEVE